MMHLRIDFGWDFGGFWEGKWKQVGTKIAPKIDFDLKAEKSTKR